MTINIKMLNKILTNRMWQHVESIVDQDQGGFTVGMNRWFTIQKSTNVIVQYINRIKDKNHMKISLD